jgi:hypothetical protein
MGEVRHYTSKVSQPGDETMIVSTIALTPERCEAPEEVIRIRLV